MNVIPTASNYFSWSISDFSPFGQTPRDCNSFRLFIYGHTSWSVLNIAHDPEAIMELAEFGVILLMFLIGLELRPQRLWEMRDSIFVMGSLQVVITGIILMLTVLLLFQQHLAASFVIGFALALSSTTLYYNF